METKPEIKVVRLVTGIACSHIRVETKYGPLYQIMAPRSLSDQEFGELDRAGVFEGNVIQLAKETKMIVKGEVFYRYFFEITT